MNFMKRRQLIRGVASTSLLAFGSASAAGQVADSAESGATHVAVRQSDGSHEVHPAGRLLGGPEDIKCQDECDVICCSECHCDCCGCFVCD